MAKKATDERQKIFTDKAEAEKEARYMNDQRKPNKNGKIVGNYKAYVCKLQDRTCFIVAKSPIVAASYAGVHFGIVVESDRKVPVKKVNPKWYLDNISEEERKEWEAEIEARKKAA